MDYSLDLRETRTGYVDGEAVNLPLLQAWLESGGITVSAIAVDPAYPWQINVTADAEPDRIDSWAAYWNNIAWEAGDPLPDPPDIDAGEPPDVAPPTASYTLDLSDTTLGYTAGDTIRIDQITQYLADKGASVLSVTPVLDAAGVETGEIQVTRAIDGAEISAGNWSTFAGATSVTNYGQVSLGEPPARVGTNTSLQQGLRYGDSSDASGVRSTAVGTDAVASGDAASAFGDAAAATGVSSVAIGPDTIASKTGTISVGSQAQATGSAAMAIGAASRATTSALAVGVSAIASGISAIAQGTGAQALAVSSQAIGVGAIVESDASASQAIGNGAHVYGVRSLAFGVDATAGSVSVSGPLGYQQTAVGANTKAIGVGATAIGATAQSATYGFAAGAWQDSLGGAHGAIAPANSTAIRAISKADNTIAIGGNLVIVSAPEDPTDLPHIATGSTGSVLVSPFGSIGENAFRSFFLGNGLLDQIGTGETDTGALNANTVRISPSSGASAATTLRLKAAAGAYHAIGTTNAALTWDGTAVSLVGHTHAASAITSGTLDVARIPSLTASKISDFTAAVKAIGTVGYIKSGATVVMSDADRLNFGTGLLTAQDNAISSQANVAVDFGTGTNQAARGDHTHAGIGTVAYVKNNETVALTNADRLAFYPGIVASVSSTIATQVNIQPDWGTGANQVPRGNHTHTSSGITDFTSAVQAIGTVRYVKSGATVTNENVDRLNFYTGLKQSVPSAIPSQVDVEVDFGTGTNQAARGDHTHAGIGPAIYFAPQKIAATGALAVSTSSPRTLLTFNASGFDSTKTYFVYCRADVAVMSNGDNGIARLGLRMGGSATYPEQTMDWDNVGGVPSPYSVTFMRALSGATNADIVVRAWSYSGAISNFQEGYLTVWAVPAS